MAWSLIRIKGLDDTTLRGEPDLSLTISWNSGVDGAALVFPNSRPAAWSLILDKGLFDTEFAELPAPSPTISWNSGFELTCLGLGLPNKISEATSFMNVAGS